MAHGSTKSSISSKRARQNKAQVEESESADHGYHQVSKRIQNFTALQHGMQFHDQRRQGREAATESYGEQKPVLIGYKAGFVKPGGTGNKLRDNSHDKTAKQIGA